MGISEIQLSEVLDVLIVASLLWAGIVWLRKTRARMASVGLGIGGVVYLLAGRLDLELTAEVELAGRVFGR